MPVPFGFLIDHGHAEMVLVLAAILLAASLLCMGTAKASISRAAAAPLRRNSAFALEPDPAIGSPDQ